jgi:DNA polymerase-1
VKLEDVTKQMRRAAKATNFGILYGQGAHGLAQTAEITYWEAKEFIDKYFESYVEISKFIENTIEKACVDGYVTTLFNRKRYLPEINSNITMIKKAAERMAVNTPLQGTAADMIKVAMINVAKILDKNEIKMISQVHDELLFEVKSDKVEIYAKKIKKIMEEVISLKVPVIVDASAGDNWGELKELSITN